MEWVPATVNAFANLKWEQLLGLCVFTLAMGIVVVIWRHSSQLITLLTRYVEMQGASVEMQSVSVEELKKQTESLADISAKVTTNNAMTAKMLAKMPSGDKPICNAPAPKEVQVTPGNA